MKKFTMKETTIRLDSAYFFNGAITSILLPDDCTLRHR